MKAVYDPAHAGYDPHFSCARSPCQEHIPARACRPLAGRRTVMRDGFGGETGARPIAAGRRTQCGLSGGSGNGP